MTAGGLQLLVLGFVTPLIEPVSADCLRVVLLPGAARSGSCSCDCLQLVEHVFDVAPDVQVVSPRRTARPALVQGLAGSPPATLQAKRTAPAHRHLLHRNVRSESLWECETHY